MSFDGNGNLIDVVGPAERGSPSQSLSVIIEDAFGSSVAHTFTGDWVTENTYDGFDRLIQTTDAVGGTTSNTFDPGNRPIATEAAGSAGGTTPTDRTGSGNVALSSSETYFDEAGRAYDSQQDVFLNTTSGNSVPSTRTITHTGGGLAFNSTTNSNNTSATLTSGESSYVLTRQVYDRAGRVYITASDNTAQTTYAYDGASRQILMTDPLGNQTQNSFDANGNVVGTTRVELCTIEGVTTTESFASATFFDCLNRATVTAMQGPDGSFVPSLAIGTCASWATLPVSCPGWLTPTGTIFTFAGYDSRGNRTVAIDPKANTTVLQYDGASRQLRTLQHLRGNGSGSNAVFDTVTTTSNYDGNSRLIRLIDDNGGTTTWTYDTLDRQTVMTFHDGSTRTSVYDLANDVITYTDENGSVFANTFDVLGRKITVAITLASSVVGTTAQSFEYDGLSRMTFAEDDIDEVNADTDLIYDSLGRVIEEVQLYGGDTGYVTHDAWTSLTSTDLTYPSGRQVSSGYDALYRRNTVTETSGGASIAQWQFFGNRTATQTLGNGLTCSMMNDAGTHSAVQAGVPNPAWGDKTTDRLGYDGSGRMIAKRFLPSGSTTSRVGFTSSYDPSSNKLFERALHAESRSALYRAYDSMNRLGQYERGILGSDGASIATPITLPGTENARIYNLDGLGNWKNTVYTPEGGSPTTEIRQHNKLNEITRFATTPVLYDHGNNASSGNPLIAQRGNGNIANDGTRIYAYDALNRLTTVSSTGTGTPQVAAYTDDALGRRIRKIVTNSGITGTVANITYTYYYDNQQIVEELTTDNSTLRQFVWGQYIDELTQLKTYGSTGTQPLAAGTYYPLQDMLYRTTATTDSSASVVEAYDYDAYGNTLMYSGPGTDGLWFTNDDVATAQPACEFLFTGRQYDPETQIYFYRARYYDPRLGRFTTRDPSDEQGLNSYEFVVCNPVRFIDSSGNIPQEPPWQIGPVPMEKPDTFILGADCKIFITPNPVPTCVCFALVYCLGCDLKAWEKSTRPCIHQCCSLRANPCSANPFGYGNQFAECLSECLMGEAGCGACTAQGTPTGGASM
jgi:RHS repeat-associated protein